MPNGKLGDHPLSDILTHGGSEFGEPVDSMVKEMSEHPEFPSVREQIANMLMELSPIGKEPDRAPELRREAVAMLEQVRKTL